jgi:hypothetical protein
MQTTFIFEFECFAKQVVTVSSKYVLENQTGVPIEVKQRGLPDSEVGDEVSLARCAHWGSFGMPKSIKSGLEGITEQLGFST